MQAVLPAGPGSPGDPTSGRKEEMESNPSK